ncbi:MAG: malto-oligosyltrehalose synthase [Acidobacteriota bacterium]
MIAPVRRPHPVSTYRLQLHDGYGFSAAAALVPYLDRLGITDAYTSPYLKASPGSTHGYDICDHTQLNPELGTMADYESFSAALRARGLGHILDIVPNHMAADSTSNPWWRDVLENGPSSRFSAFFDIDWDPVKPELKARVLLPVLGEQYGVVLERGELQLEFDAGTLVLRYGAMNLPLNPRSLTRALGLDAARTGHRLTDDHADSREYLSILTALANLPPYTQRGAEQVAERHRETGVARARLARLAETSPEVRAHIAACLRVANGTPGAAASFDVLHDLLEHQAYRLAYWRTAFDEINYRRFFDVNGLVALRMEDPLVFQATHALLRDLVAAGHVTGFRVDHPDGLFDPKAYLDRLQHMASEARANAGESEPGQAHFYVVVEKILSGDEQLRADWPAAGTTGYDFLNAVCGLFINSREVRPLTQIYARFTGRQKAFDDEAFASKRVITLTSMASELSVLAHDLNRISEADRRYRDFTLDSCRKALREVLACVPVYRTYIREDGWSDFDRAVIDTAIAEANRRNPVMEESILRFIHDVLLAPADEAGAEQRLRAREARRFAMKFQQFSGPVQAKGVEDTAFYRHHLLVAANDVGGHPGKLGVTVPAFHRANQQRCASRPLEMLATSTHDTKRGEDARVRLTVLSEVAGEWRRVVAEWKRINAGNRTRVGTSWAPDRNDEYLFYQAALGVWPAEAEGDALPARAPEAFVARIDAYMQKAVREAKVHTSWIDQDEEYGRAIRRFVERTLAGRTSLRFLASFVPFARRVARVGAINSLAQLTLKLASPGVPDFFQGTELWDLTLVDPDNRRPVDFAHREAMLDSLEPIIGAAERGEDVGREVAALLAAWPDARIKLLATACGLRFRRRHAAFMTEASYLPLSTTGAASEHLVAFGRQHSSGTLIAIVPRLIASFVSGKRWPLGAEAWSDTTIQLDEELRLAEYRHLITGEVVRPSPSGAIAAADVFRTCPVALLWRSAGSPPFPLPAGH